MASFGEVDLDLELLGEPAPGVDLGHAGDAPEPRADHPVLERPELGQVVLGVLAREEVVVDLAEARRHRAHRRPRDPLGELDLAQAFVDLLPGEVDVGARRSKMATTCERPNFEIERTSSSPFRPPRAYSTGKVMQPLDLLGRELRGDGVDLHLHRGRVGEGVERQPDRGPDPEDDQDARQRAGRRSGS